MHKDIMRSKKGEFACPQHKTEWEEITQTDFKISAAVSGFECGPRLIFSGFSEDNSYLNGLWTFAMDNGNVLKSGCLTVQVMGSRNINS